jgi:hypothetical protein
MALTIPTYPHGRVSGFCDHCNPGWQEKFKKVKKEIPK